MPQSTIGISDPGRVRLAPRTSPGQPGTQEEPDDDRATEDHGEAFLV